MIKNNKYIDQEWVDLIKEAKQAGLSLEDLRAFFDRGKLPDHTLVERNYAKK